MRITSAMANSHIICGQQILDLLGDEARGIIAVHRDDGVAQQSCCRHSLLSLTSKCMVMSRKRAATLGYIGSTDASIVIALTERRAVRPTTSKAGDWRLTMLQM